MANTIYSFGLRPSRSGAGGSIRTNNYPILNSYSTSIYFGDLVTLSSAGAVNAITATGGTKILGVFMGAFWTDTSLFGQPRWSPQWNAPGSTVASLNDAYAIVCDDPWQRFLIGSTGLTTNTPAAAGNATTTQSSQLDIGMNADIVYTAGNARNGISGVVLDQSTIAVTNTLPLRLTGFKNAPDNVLPITASANGLNAIYEVMINPTFHFYTQATGL